MSAMTTAKEAAEIIGISQVSLCLHRKRGTGPKWIDCRSPGAKVAKPFYYRDSVEEYAARRNEGDHAPGMSDRQRIILLEKRVALVEKRLTAGRAS